MASLWALSESGPTTAELIWQNSHLAHTRAPFSGRPMATAMAMVVATATAMATAVTMAMVTAMAILGAMAMAMTIVVAMAMV